MKILWFATLISFLISLFKSRKKTIKALKIAIERFSKLLSDFAILLALISIALTLFPPERIKKLLEGPGLFVGTVIGAVIGSITFMPGFISYPLAGILSKEGVPYTVLAAFLITMMMVGVLTFPMESRLFGRKLALWRNITYFVIAIIAAVFIGIVFGELM